MTVLITGANRGIGAELARRYVARGARVIGTTRGATPPDLQDAVEWKTLDVTDPASFAALARDLDGCQIDLLICNAGVYLDKGHSLAGGYGADLWAGTFATNVTGVFLTVQTLLPNLQCGDTARVAVIASIMGSSTRAPGGSYIYRASKAAAVNLARNLAADLDGLGIAVGAYHPGWVQTDMGGTAAEIDVETAANGLLARFDALSPETAGCFLSYDGTELPF